MRTDQPLGQNRAASLVDVLDRVLDKGLVIAGDIKISLAEVELLTIRVRLLVCSLDKAEAIGLDWWKYDRHLSPGVQSSLENEQLREKIRELEARLEQVGDRVNGRARRRLTNQTAPKPRRRRSGRQKVAT